MTDPTDSAPLLRTPLHALHHRLDARMVPFAGYDMPVQYDGILAEHTHTREAAGLFDVSHMGQAFVVGPDHETAARALERLVPSDIVGLKPGRMRYTLLLKEDGGILDDLIVTRPAAADEDGRLFLVVNASRKAADYEVIRAGLPNGVQFETVDDRALVALQGPQAGDVLAAHSPVPGTLTFMTAAMVDLGGAQCHVTRSGYTGEDGFEISVPEDAADPFVSRLLEDERVRPVGLGARDTLRLEAGLCLYGNDIDESTGPVEADLGFAISKRRRAEADFPGARNILAALEAGSSRKRVGLRLDGRAPARAGAEIHDADGNPVGHVTSGGFAPTVGAPIAMGYVSASHAETGTPLFCIVRGKALPAHVSAMPFVPHGYVR
ncbi:MAG: glycine cleavage system aminomethyltransferase GcvT [Pseudomonadota bacterium]